MDNTAIVTQVHKNKKVKESKENMFHISLVRCHFCLIAEALYRVLRGIPSEMISDQFCYK